MNHKVIILTGIIQTGKTTSLIKWSEHKTNVFGILTPIVNGKRVFTNISNKEVFKMEATDNEEILLVGKYSFSKNSFDKAKQILINASKQKSGYLIVDEVGPLELRQEGLFSAIIHILQNSSLQIILVVREGLVEKVIDIFNLKNVSVIYKDQLATL